MLSLPCRSTISRGLAGGLLQTAFLNLNDFPNCKFRQGAARMLAEPAETALPVEPLRGRTPVLKTGLSVRWLATPGGLLRPCNISLSVLGIAAGQREGGNARVQGQGGRHHGRGERDRAGVRETIWR